MASQPKHYTLREYQSEMIARIRSAWAEGKRSVMCQMPTGTGKTVVAVSLIREWVVANGQKTRGQIVVVAHRREILDQICQTLKKHGLDDELDRDVVIVESIQKLYNEFVDDAIVIAPELVIVDEAHHATAETYKMLWKVWPKAMFVGMTATPSRLKKEGFSELFDILICSWPVKRFIMSGWLADYDYISVRPDSEMLQRLSLLRKKGPDGDYQIKEMASIMDNRPSIEQLYSSYKKYADGRQGIIYAINREHASHIKAYYEERGESIMLIDSKTPIQQRDAMMETYREGKIRIFVNCEIAGEGVDVPNVSFIQMARPTLSLNKYLQQVGRGLRPNASEQMKTVILDNVGMYYMFGLPHEDHDWQEMFKVGQILPDVDRRAPLLKLLRKDKHFNVDKGHNLEMLNVTGSGKSSSRKKAKSMIEMRPVKGLKGCCTLYVKDKQVEPGYVRVVGPLDGMFAVYRHKELNRMRSVYDEDGYCVYYNTFDDTQILPGNYLVYNNSDGFKEYYDLLLKENNYVYPVYKFVGKAAFALETDGWHLRNPHYGHLQVVEKSIRKCGNAVSLCFAEQPSVRYFVLGRSKTVLRFLGFEDDSTEVLINDVHQNTIILRKDEKLLAVNRDDTTQQLFEKWEEAINQGQKVSVCPASFKHEFITESNDFYIFEEHGLWGWKEGGVVVCPPKFKKIRCFRMGYFLVDVERTDVESPGIRDYKSIVVDKQGKIVYDEYHVLKLYNGQITVLRPGYFSDFVIFLKNGYQEYTYKDQKSGATIHNIDGYILRYVVSKRLWAPDNYRRSKILMPKEFFIQDSMFCGIDYISRCQIIAFPHDKKTFYRVKFKDSRGYILEEVVTGTLYLYNNEKHLLLIEDISEYPDYIKFKEKARDGNFLSIVKL